MNLRVSFQTLLMGLVIVALSGDAVAQSGGRKQYKWVDEHGNVHFSDQVPPDAAQYARDEINDQGIVVKSVDRAKTPEELAAMAQAARDAEIEAERLAELERQDRAMLNSYASERDLVRAYEQQVELLVQTIDSTRMSIQSQERNLAELLGRAADLDRAGKPVHDTLKTSIESTKDNIAQQQAYIARKEAEKAEVDKNFQVQLTRYRDIVARDQAAKARVMEGG